MTKSLWAITITLTFLMSVAEARNYPKSMWGKYAYRVEGLIAHRDASSQKCIAASTVELSKRFMATRDAAGNLCRIYDLSFPTLSSLFAKKPASSLRIK
jgi:hypothetical protein